MVPGFFVPETETVREKYFTLRKKGKDYPYVPRSKYYYVVKRYKNSAKQYVFNLMNDERQLKYTDWWFIKKWSKWFLERIIGYQLYINRTKSVQYSQLTSDIATLVVSRLINRSTKEFQNESKLIDESVLQTLEKLAQRYYTQAGDNFIVTPKTASVCYLGALVIQSKIGIAEQQLLKIEDVRERLTTQWTNIAQFRTRLSRTFHNFSYIEEWIQAFTSFAQDKFYIRMIASMLPLSVLDINELVDIRSTAESFSGVFPTPHITTEQLNNISSISGINKNVATAENNYVLAIFDYIASIYHDSDNKLGSGVHNGPYITINDSIPTLTSSDADIIHYRFLEGESAAIASSGIPFILNIYMNPINLQLAMLQIATLVNFTHNYQRADVTEIESRYVDIDGIRWWMPVPHMRVWAYGVKADGSYDLKPSHRLLGITSSTAQAIQWKGIQELHTWMKRYGYIDSIVLVRDVSNLENVNSFRFGNIMFEWNSISLKYIHISSPFDNNLPPIDSSLDIGKYLGTEYTMVEKEIEFPQPWLLHFVDGSSIKTRPNSITDKIWKIYNYNLYNIRRDAWNHHHKKLEETVSPRPYDMTNNPLIVSMIKREKIMGQTYYNPRLQSFLIPDITPNQLYIQLTTGPSTVKRNKALDWKYDAAFRGISLQDGRLGRILYLSADPTHSKNVFPWLRNRSVWLVSQVDEIGGSTIFHEKSPQKVSNLTKNQDVIDILEGSLKNSVKVWDVISKYDNTYDWRVKFDYDLFFGGLDFNKQQNLIIYWSWKPKQSRRIFPFINEDTFFSVRQIQWISPAHTPGEYIVYKIPETDNKLISIIGWKQTGKDQLEWLTPQRFGSILREIVQKYNISQLSIVWPFGDGISLEDAEPYLNYTHISKVRVTVYKTVTESGDPLPYIPKMSGVIDIDDIDKFLGEIESVSSTEFVDFYKSNKVFLPDTALSYTQLQTDRSTLEELTGNDYTEDQVFVTEEYQEKEKDYGEEEEEKEIDYEDEEEEEEE